MGAAMQPMPAAVLIANLPWRTAPRDRREVRKILAEASLDALTPLGGELLDMLYARVSDCRDLFVLRGVHPKRHSVLQLAGRSLATDETQVARLDGLAGGNGRALLSLLSNLIELRAGHPARPQAKAVTGDAPAASKLVAKAPVAMAEIEAPRTVAPLRAANDDAGREEALPLAA